MELYTSRKRLLPVDCSAVSYFGSDSVKFMTCSQVVFASQQLKLNENSKKNVCGQFSYCFLPNALCLFHSTQPCGLDSLTMHCKLFGKNKWNSVLHQPMYVCYTDIQFKTAYNHLVKANIWDSPSVQNISSPWTSWQNTNGPKWRWILEGIFKMN